MAKSKYKISICMVCMNRLHQLKQTLPQNIQDNANYENIEFVVLDYNSQDGMEDWIRGAFNDYIVNGKVVYYKTFEPKSFSHSHSKNLAFKIATGQILCNISADNYTGKNFANYVNDAFNDDNNIVLTPIDFHKTNKNHHSAKDVLGKVCVKKSDFLAVKGFDERMNKYGFEDYDFVNRLEISGVKRVLIEDHNYLKYIAHDDSERYTFIGGSLYVRYCTPSMSEIIFLYNDQHFEKGIIIDNFSSGAENFEYAYQQRDSRFEFSLTEPGFETGTWEDTDKSVIRFSLINSNVFEFDKINQTEQLLLVDRSNNLFYYNVTDQSAIDGILDFNQVIYSRSIMEESLKNKTSIVNDTFGRGTVYKKFQFNAPINV